MSDCNGAAISLPETPDEEGDAHSPSRTGNFFLMGDGSSSGDGDGDTPPPKRNKTVASGGEIIRKPRGRPPGSKNKPKAPIVITREIDSSAMKTVVLEISAGMDIIEMVSEYARRNNVGICVVKGSGIVTNITLRLPAFNSSMTLRGEHYILSLSATFLDTSVSSSMSVSPPVTISVGGNHGQVYGGVVMGELIAATNVVLVVATFVSHLFRRIPEDDDETEDGLVVGSDSGTDIVYNTVQNPTPLNCQMPSDLPWPSTSRPSHY